MIRNGILILETCGKEFIGLRLQSPWVVTVFEGIPEEMPKNDEKTLLPVLRDCLEYWSVEKSLENDEWTDKVRKRIETILDSYNT